MKSFVSFRDAGKAVQLAFLFVLFLLFTSDRANGQKPVSTETTVPQNVSSGTITANVKVSRNKEQLRTAKSYARASFKKYLKRKVLEKTREMVIEIKEWSIDEEKERYMIEYEVSFEILKDDFYGDEWITLRRTFILTCDLDGQNANLRNNEEKLNFIFENLANQ